jgi:hypothetical protein
MEWGLGSEVEAALLCGDTVLFSLVLAPWVLYGKELGLVRCVLGMHTFSWSSLLVRLGESLQLRGSANFFGCWLALTGPTTPGFFNEGMLEGDLADLATRPTDVLTGEASGRGIFDLPRPVGVVRVGEDGTVTDVWPSLGPVPSSRTRYSHFSCSLRNLASPTTADSVAPSISRRIFESTAYNKSVESTLLTLQGTRLRSL